jgi:uncharacterized membrane protein HdeD (DUF308 family)
MIDRSATPPAPELSQFVGQHRGLFIFEGLVFLLLGVLAILFPFVASIALEIYLGALLLVGGIATGIRAIVAKGISHRGSSIVLAVLTIITGLLLLIFVRAGLLALTLVLAVFFVVQGVFEIFHGAQAKGQAGRGWMIASGIAGVIVGLLLWSGLPSTAVWAVGTLTGINFIFTGVALLVMATAQRAGVSA